MKKTYTKEEKAEAMKKLQTDSITKVSKDLNISRVTLTRWKGATAKGTKVKAQKEKKAVTRKPDLRVLIEKRERLIEALCVLNTRIGEHLGLKTA